MSPDSLSLESLTMKFLDFEKKYELLDGEYSYIWESIRFGVHKRYIDEILKRGEAHDIINCNSFGIIKKSVFYLNHLWKGIKSFIKYFLYNKKSIEYVYLGSHRRKLGYDNLYWDIYTDPIVDNFKTDRSLTLEYQYIGRHSIPPKTNNILYLDFLNLRVWLHKIFFKSKSSNIDQYYSVIQERFNAELTNSVNIIHRAKQTVIYFPIRVSQYYRILKKINPKILFMICGYGKESAIKAAKDLHIPVIEIQHGVLSKLHMGYHFPNKKKEMFSNYLFTFGPAWAKMAHFPIPQHKIIPIGYQYLNTAVASYKCVRKKNQILFFSQGTIGDRLSEFAVNLLSYLPSEVKIVYKLHPGEYLRWKTEYKALYDASKKGLITVIAGDIPYLYELMAESKWQIGVNSTALFEGMAFKCKTYIVDFPGIEYVEALINNNEFILVQKPEQIDFTYDPDELNYFTEEYFSKDTETKFKAAIDFVMQDYYA
jgi:hypothetical protein